jgi:hypothetical protein
MEKTSNLGLVEFAQSDFSQVSTISLGLKITLSSVRPATNEEWDKAWAACGYSTYFHSREWAEIWSDYTNGSYQPAAFVFRFSDGTEVVFPLAIVRSCRGLIRSYVSSPAGTYGGWLSQDTLAGEHMNLMLQYLIANSGGMWWRLNPYCADMGDAARLWPVAVAHVTEDVTHVLDLRSGFENVYRGISRSHRSGAKKALRFGVSIEKARATDDWQEYYRVYEDSLRRWGPRATARYGWRLFRIMANRNSDHIVLWLARYEGEVIAGAVCCYSKAHVVYWHGAALERQFHLRGAKLLFETAIRDACNRGYSWFDFNPNGGHEGPRLFKERYGAKVMPCPVVAVRGPALRIYEWVSKSAKSLLRRSCFDAGEGSKFSG